MRLIYGAVLLILAAAVGWLAATRLPAPDPIAVVDAVSTSAPAEADGGPIRRVPQPVHVIVAPDTPSTPDAAYTPDAPIDLTKARPAATAEVGPAAAAPGPAARPARNAPVVDESALRYFARQGDQRRLDAEIARLKALYPDWVPPADPTAPEIFVDTELDELWQLFSQGEYPEVRSRIADRQTREPEWEPPAVLIELLDQADARIRLTNASNAKQWKTVIETAAATPSLLTCDYVDVLWRVAEAFAKTDRPDRAKDAYVYILTNCDSPAERLATVQKAVDVLAETDIAELLSYDRGGEFEEVADTLLRRRVGVTAEDPELTSSPEELARIEALAADGNAADALLLGWYYYRHKEPGKAVDWFDKARKRDPESAKAVEGYALALIDLKRYADAEATSYDWNEKSADNLAAYLIAAVALLAVEPPLRISEPVLQRMAEVIVRVKSLQGGEQLGWYAYNLGQVRTALRWFEIVRRWDPEYEPAAYGLAVVYWALKDKARVNALIREWGSRSERIANIGKPGRTELRGSRPIVDVIVDAPPVRTVREDPAYAYVEPEIEPEIAPESPVYVDAAPAATGGGSSGSCTGTTPTRALSPESALRRGWCLMDLNRPAEAAIAFDIALQSTSSKTREDAAYGATLANLRSGVTDRASVTAAAAPMSAKRQGEVTLSILSQQAVAAYADGRYVETILALEERARLAPEQTDLMMLRGWSYFKLGRLADARRIFEAVARTGLPEGDKGLAAVAAEQAGFGGGRF